MASRKSRSPAALRSEIEGLLKKRDNMINELAKEFVTNLYDEGILLRLSDYNKQERRMFIRYIAEDMDRYFERLDAKRKVRSEQGLEAVKKRKKNPVNPFAMPLSDEEFNKIAEELGAEVHSSDE